MRTSPLKFLTHVIQNFMFSFNPFNSFYYENTKSIQDRENSLTGDKGNTALLLGLG